MAETLSDQLLRLAESDSETEVRNAALIVLAEIGTRSPKVERGLCHLLDDADCLIRSRTLRAIGKLRVEAALPELLDRIRRGGEESQAAAQAASQLGSKAIRSLQNLMGEVPPGLRQRIAAALGSGDTASAEAAAVRMLLQNDPHVVDAAARTLLDKIPSLDRSHRRRLADQILEILDKSTEELSSASEGSLLRVLAAADSARGEAAFWQRIATSYPAEIRAAALNALGSQARPIGREHLRHLLACASDENFRVVAPALMLLRKTDVDSRALKEWLALFDAPDSAAREFAIEKLGSLDKPEVARALLGQLNFPQKDLRERSIRQLASLKHGRAELTRALLEANTPEEAWRLASAQAGLFPEYADSVRQEMFQRACVFLEKEDRRSDALLFGLRIADERALRDWLETRANALRKKKQYATALAYYRVLVRDPACTDPVRFEMACCVIKVSGHPLDAEARSRDAGIHQLASILRRQGADLLELITDAKWLDADDLFYIGFHFAESSSAERDFGADVLRLLIRRYPRAKQAKEARSKLKSQGFKAISSA